MGHSPATTGGKWARRIGVMVVVVWAFALGVLVGQGSIATPEQIKAVARWLGIEGLFSPLPPAPPKPLSEPKVEFFQGLERHPPLPSQGLAAGRGVYVVQVASFRQARRARALAEELVRSGYPAYIQPRRLKRVGLRYRVEVGPYASARDAQAVARRIRLSHRLAAYVSRREP